MKKGQSYHGNKMKIRNKIMPKVEIVEDDNNDTVTHTFFPNIFVDKTTMPE